MAVSTASHGYGHGPTLGRERGPAAKAADALASLRREATGEVATDADEMDQTAMVRQIGGAVIAIAIVAIVVNEVLTVGIINNSSGPFSGVISSLETTGVAAMTLLVVGLLVAAASQLMGLFGGFGGR